MAERPLLSVRNVTMRFGGLTAVKSLNMTVPPLALYGLIGPNGAGKTTVFNVLTGVYCPTEGEIELGGTRIEKKKPYEITRLGAARTFQNIRLFSDMTVLQNVMTAHHLRSRQMLSDAVLGTGLHHAEGRRRASAPWSCSKSSISTGRPMSRRRACHTAASAASKLRGALATEPKLLLLDEPAAGMNPQESQDLMNLIVWLRDHMKLTILLVEHNMKVVMGICETVQVIDYGSRSRSEPPTNSEEPKVIEAYLGGA